MENWGLITYRTTAILFDEVNSDAKYKNRVAYVVAHGMSKLGTMLDATETLVQNLLISGLEILSQWIGGANYGSMKDLQHGWAG